MELQLGKSIMGFPPGAVCSNMCVIFNWQEMDDFTNPPPAHLRASNTDWWWYKANSKSGGRRDNNCKFGFHINKPRLLMSSRLFCQQRRAHMVPGFRKLARHMEMQTFHRRCLSFLTWGHDRPAMCECVRVWNPHAVVCVCVFFPRHSILLDFWAQSAVHMALAAWGTAYVCNGEADQIGQRGLGMGGGWVCDGGVRDKEGVSVRHPWKSVTGFL